MSALTLGSGITSSNAVLAAPTKAACIAAFDNAQRARRERHFGTARAELLTCSQQACPAIVRADCAGVLREVEAAQPTIVLKAEDAKGNDLTDVRVELNGATLASSLDGRALRVDPGKLSLVFKHPQWDPVTVDVVIAETEKSRIVSATLGPPAEPDEQPDPSGALTSGQERPEPKRTVAGYVVPGGLAVLGAGALVFAGVTRLSLGQEADDLRARCAPECSQADRDRMSDDLVLTNVMLGAGISTLVLAAVTWFVLTPKSPGPRAQMNFGAPLTW